MRGDHGICGSLFGYIDLEKRVRADHPLRVIREVANTALKSLTGEFAKLYSPIIEVLGATTLEVGDVKRVSLPSGPISTRAMMRSTRRQLWAAS